MTNHNFMSLVWFFTLLLVDFPKKNRSYKLIIQTIKINRQRRFSLMQIWRMVFFALNQIVTLCIGSIKNNKIGLSINYNQPIYFSFLNFVYMYIFIQIRPFMGRNLSNVNQSKKVWIVCQIWKKWKFSHIYKIKEDVLLL